MSLHLNQADHQDLTGLLACFLGNCHQTLSSIETMQFAGRIVKVTGLVIEVSGI